MHLLTRLRRRRMKPLKAFGKSPSGGLLVSLCDTNEDLCECWRQVFADVAGVEVLHGSLMDAGCDAIVSPANRFGDMGGGVDKHIDDFFGGAAQTAVMAAIREHYFGELPVGAALLVDIPARSGTRYVISAPTMRTPGSVQGSLNAYLSFRAALVAVLRFNRTGATRLKTMGVPGLCTGVGGMDTITAAEQMRAAYDNVLGGGWERIVHPAMAPFAFGDRKMSWTTSND